MKSYILLLFCLEPYKWQGRYFPFYFLGLPSIHHAHLKR